MDSFGEQAVAVDINTNESWILIFRCRLLPLVAVVWRQLLLEGHLNLDLLRAPLWGLLHHLLFLNLLQPGEVFADLSDSYVSNILVIFEVTPHNSLLTKVALLSLIQHLLCQPVNFLSIVELKVVKLADVEYSLRVTSTWT
jgi:hypothetical protein